jgi:hypothetical protein
MIRSRVGPYSRAGALATVDGRTKAARFLRETRRQLTAHVGGTPSATQSVLIERAAMLRLHLAQLDEKALAAGGSLTDHDSRQYLAWSNSLDRAMRTLGIHGAPAPAPSLAAYLAARAQSAASADAPAEAA